jgi:hypothetical protein
VEQSLVRGGEDEIEDIGGGREEPIGRIVVLDSHGATAERDLMFNGASSIGLRVSDVPAGRLTRRRSASGRSS